MSSTPFLNRTTLLALSTFQYPVKTDEFLQTVQVAVDTFRKSILTHPAFAVVHVGFAEMMENTSAPRAVVHSSETCLTRVSGQTKLSRCIYALQQNVPNNVLQLRRVIVCAECAPMLRSQYDVAQFLDYLLEDVSELLRSLANTHHLSYEVLSFLFYMAECFESDFDDIENTSSFTPELQKAVSDLHLVILQAARLLAPKLPGTEEEETVSCLLRTGPFTSEADKHINTRNSTGFSVSVQMDIILFLLPFVVSTHKGIWCFTMPLSTVGLLDELGSNVVQHLTAADLLPSTYEEISTFVKDGISFNEACLTAVALKP